MTQAVPIPVDNVPTRATWDRLKAEPATFLIDVRTRAEWSFVGTPDLSSIGKQVLLVEWLTFPENRPNPAFVAQLTATLEQMGADRDAGLYFICRSGARSLQAANAMAAAGYRNCHNVAEGFEGPLDAARHRGRQSGWKADELPWVQA
ncbi:MAG: rhodanese-like domain-containing protein [Hyphomicrobiaceae bacterium]